MKSSKTISYVLKFKYLMLIPIVIVLASIVIGAILNLNYDYDFRRVSNFTVKFNTTITEKEYNNFELAVKEIISDHDFEEFRVERIGSGAQNGIFVRIPDDDSNLDNKIDELKTYLEENLLSSTESISSAVVVTTSDTGFSLPKNATKMIWLSILAVACITLFVFFYNWIRYNLMAGCSSAASIGISVVMLLASIVAFRIPINYYFVLPFIIMLITLIISSSVMNNYIKSTLSMESYSKTTNSDRVEETTSKYLWKVIAFDSMIIIPVLIVMFFGGPSLIYLGISVILGLIISAFVALFINTSLWSFWYKRDKDNVLRRRIEAEQKKEEEKKSGKKADEKIVV